MQKLILGLLGGVEMTPEEQIAAMKNAGWDGFFTDWFTAERCAEFKRFGDALGMKYQSIHAPFKTVDKMWEPGAEGEEELARQIACVEGAAAVGVPIVVAHCIKGMEKNSPNALGEERFGKLFEAAERCGILLALENTEGECYLETLLHSTRRNGNIRFCIDTGHEICYNERADLIGKYAPFLLCTHLNDNMGRTGEAITWWDDSHMLPFDGTVDWRGVAARLRAAGYRGDLTFELTMKNKPERHTHDLYAGLDYNGFIALALERARAFREILISL